jgi:hypothetical protein
MVYLPPMRSPGQAWKDDVPENMAPPLDRFFHGT